MDPIYIGVEIGARIILAVLGICIHYKVPVFQRRVHEKDWPDYSYPYAEQQMFPEATATGALIAIVCLSLVTGITVVFFAGKWPAKLCLEESILYVLGVTLAGLCSFVAGELTKRMYGRLRPDYLARCFGPNVKEWPPWSQIGEIPTCDSKIGWADLEDGRMSFPSAHTMFSWTLCLFSAYWLYGKLLLFRNVGALRIVVPFCPILIALVITISRTSDYRHHFTDVMAGMILGIVVATLVFKAYYVLSLKPITPAIYSSYKAKQQDCAVEECPMSKLKETIEDTLTYGSPNSPRNEDV